MSRDVVCVGEEVSIAAVTAIFEARHIRRVPVLREGQLAGIVTRADLIRALAAQTSRGESDRPRSDESIRTELLAELMKHRWWYARWSNVLVNKGVVRYIGVLVREADKEEARVAAENVAGVRGVEDRRLQYGDWQPLP